MSVGDNFGIHRSGSSRSNADDRGQAQILSDFLIQLEDYTPTVRILCVDFVVQ